MRRVALLLVVLILGSTLIASAATLDVDGGTIQVFRVEVEIEMPTSTVGSIPSLSVPPP